MRSEHFFSWPRRAALIGLDRRTLCRVGIRMVAAGPTLVLAAGIVVPLAGLALEPLGVGAVTPVLLLGASFAGLAYLVRGLWLLMRGLLNRATPWVAAPAPPGDGAGAAVVGRGSGLVVWVFVLLGLLGVLVWLSQEFDKYGKRARMSEGFVASGPLRAQITEAFRNGGPRDMSCSAARCGLPDVQLPSGSGVRHVSSDPAGAITIEYDFSFLPPAQRHMTLVPTWRDQVVDLSTLPQAALADAPLVWKCLDARTTVPREWLPHGRCG